MTGSLITCEVALSSPEPGRRSGWLRVPHSTDTSAYGVLPIPITVLTGARAGPTLLLLAGTHGDEYEGQIALSELARTLDPATLAGRLILLPMLNAPAAQAGTRVSPIDGGNLNRCFPGNPQGSPTEMLAHFVETVLIPEADVMLDLHSGGRSLRYPPTLLRGPGASAGEARTLDRIEAALDLPVAWVFPTSPGRASTGRTAMAAANRAGVPSVMTELGGAGVTCPTALASIARGLGRLLAALGHLPDAPPPEAPRGTRRLRALGTILAREAGIFEPLKTLLDPVTAGEPVARLHSPEHPDRAPVTIAAPHTGVILAERSLGRAAAGDALYQIAEDLPA